MEKCLSCDTVSGRFQPPGGVVYENDYWLVVLRAKPLRNPCYPFIILKRHCEHVHELSAEEAASLGQTMKLTAQAVMKVIKPAKIHFGLYAEEVKHLHVHVFPRMPDMIAGNKPNRQINRLYERLARWGLKRPYPDEEVAMIAESLRVAFRLNH